jgi:nicotinamidase-related amidase
MRIDKVLLDIEVQRDFFAPGGSLYTPQAAQAARNVRRLFAWARKEHVPVLSCVLRQRAGHRGALADTPHCVEGTEGEKRLGGTLMRRCIDMGMRGSTDLPLDIFRDYQQVIFERRITDIFRHARAERLLTELPVDTYIVCGAGAAAGIAEAVIGLRQRNIHVLLAADAILDLNDPRAEMAWLRMSAKGAVPLSTAEIILGGVAAKKPCVRPLAPVHASAGHEGGHFRTSEQWTEDVKIEVASNK